MSRPPREVDVEARNTFSSWPAERCRRPAEGKCVSESTQRANSGSGPVETAIRAHINPGTRLPAPTGRATFTVHELNPTGIVFLLGPKQAWTQLSWDCLEGIPDVLRYHEWVRIGASRDVERTPGTLDAYLKG